MEELLERIEALRPGERPHAARRARAPVPAEADRGRGRLPGRRALFRSARSTSGSRSRCSSTARSSGERAAASPRPARSSSGSGRRRGSSARPGRASRRRSSRDLRRAAAPRTRAGRKFCVGVRHAARRRLPVLRRSERARATPSAASAARRSALDSDRASSADAPAGRAPARLGAVRRSRRLHRRVASARRGGDARAALALLRDLPAADRAATAARSRSSSATR